MGWDRDSEKLGPVDGTGLGQKLFWSRKQDGTGTEIILVPKAGRDRDLNNFGPESGTGPGLKIFWFAHISLMCLDIKVNNTVKQALQNDIGLKH